MRDSEFVSGGFSVEHLEHVVAAEDSRRHHCQTYEREISAVATSSIRLSIAAAPVPASHDVR
jgi:hypothetical protein